MPKMTKNQAKRRVDEARQKLFKVVQAGHITMAQFNKAVEPLNAIIRNLSR